jgi:hypothetical protein
LDAVTGRYVQGWRAAENSGVRREAKHIFVIVNSRKDQNREKQIRKINKYQKTQLGGLQVEQDQLHFSRQLRSMQERLRFRYLVPSLDRR